MNPVTTTITDGIALVTVDSPPVNALSQSVRAGLMDAFAALESADGIKAAILHCAGRTFMAGADVSEFGKPAAPPAIYEVAARIEALPFPVIAAIHGNALGGGLEVALGCHYRLATEEARLGFPEVTLGVIPGSGGIVRTIRCLEPEKAVTLITGGKPIRAGEAREAGLIDDVVTGDLVEAAIAFATLMAGKPLPTPLSRRQAPAMPDEAFWADATKRAHKTAKGARAPLVALDVIRAAYAEPFETGRQTERAAFERLRDSAEAAALRHVFFAERRANRPDMLGDVEPLPLDRVGVVGGGTMGAGIATALLQAGYAVTLVETNEGALAAARERLTALLVASAKRGLIAGTGFERLTLTVDFDDLAPCDLIIEAVFEDLAVKRELFARLDAVARPDAILATNTSYLDPEKLAEPVADTSRVVGLHFFSPAQVMKLVEIVRLSDTSPKTLTTAFALAKRLSKIGVLSGICEGFIGNRLLKRYRAAAEDLLIKGVSVASIDRAARAFGFPMGPFEAQDLGGLDIAFRQREGARSQGQKVPETIADVLCREGRLGQKTGGGWYDYRPGDRAPLPSPVVDSILKDRGIEAGKGDDNDPAALAQGLLQPMIAEARAILDEGIAQSPEAIDLVEIHGYGFPRWRGGLMYYAINPDKES